jgi:hypothetical protein
MVKLNQLEENTMDFGRAFSYVTQDAKWLQKVGIAALVSLIPLVGQITVLGWGIEIARRVINNDPEPLPDWNDFGGLLGKGFSAFVVTFAYLLPVILISSCSQLLVPLMGSGGNNDNSQMLVATALMIVSVCVGCFTLIYGIGVGFLLPAALGNVAATGQMSAGFRFGEVIGMVRAAPGPYLMVLLGSLLASFVASFGIILCFVGIFFTQAFAIAVNAHLWGQAYNAAKAAQAAQPVM